jgi:hypothetical protein
MVIRELLISVTINLSRNKCLQILNRIYFEREKFIVFIVIMLSYKMGRGATGGFYFHEEDYLSL